MVFAHQNKPKKRRFKRWFRNLIYLIFLGFIIFAIYILQTEKIINLNSYYQDTKIFIKNIFNKDKETVSLPQTKSEIIVDFFKTHLPSQGIEVASGTSESEDNNGNLKIYLANTKNNSGYLFVNVTDDPDYIWLTFLSAIEAEPLKTELENNFNRLEYIDLRFTNKIFYKFNNSDLNITDLDKNNTTQNNQPESESGEDTDDNHFYNPNLALPANLPVEESTSSNQ